VRFVLLLIAPGTLTASGICARISEGEEAICANRVQIAMACDDRLTRRAQQAAVRVKVVSPLDVIREIER